MTAVAARRVPMVRREVRMVEVGSRPGGGVVAGLASRGESRRLVVGVRCVLVIGLVTGVTVRRKVSVVVIYVTT